MNKGKLRPLLARAVLSWMVGVCVPAAILLAVPSIGDAKGGARTEVKNNAYIVQLAEPPVTAYKGGINGHPATKKPKGQKIDPDDPAVISYMSYLASRHDAVLGKVGGGKKLHTYGYVFNGFAAELTAAQAQKLAQMPGVLAVSKDVARALDTSSTPAFLGLSGTSGFWETAGVKGEDVVIGIVDGGIWPEHPSFSDRGDDGKGKDGKGKDDKKVYKHLQGWKGKCIAGEQFKKHDCNEKLIGARYYNQGWGGNAGIDEQLPWEFNSPRDFGGHGTHTASTAGGNEGVPATGVAAPFGSISGIAPRSRIAAYKVCWQTETTGSCFDSDSVAAIDQAVADGVDVINFSISGTRTEFLDAVEVAFLFAADAGVFVAASAGNEGATIGSGSVAHPSPWVTTVAAGTHNRNGEGSVTLGNSATYPGASFATALGSTPLIDSANAVAADATLFDAELCAPGALDASLVAGKVVLCKRGVYALVDKSLAVFDAGGVGMVLYNDPAGATTTLALVHSVPAVHVVAASGLAIKSYIAFAAGATASIAQSTIVYNTAAPFTASFSSRGPLRAGGGDLLKPDLIAPGQDVLAGVAPPGNSGRLFDLYSGTSMSSPHVAGLAALMKELHPGWSPMAIKSALMTTGSDVLDGGVPAPNTNPVLIFRQGAGHVRPSLAADPGLVFDADFIDWLGFLCGTQLPASICAGSGIPVLDPSDMNVASIAIGDLAGVQSVTRRVTNVGGAAATYTASLGGMTGFDVAVSPAALTLAAGETQSFTVTFTRTAATLNAYAGGQLTWTDGTHNVRIPVVVRPVSLAAPAQVSGSYDVTFGYTGAFTATPRGLIAPETTTGTITQDPDQTFNPADSAGTLSYDVVIPAGTTYARFSLFNADVASGADIDLYVYKGTTLVGASANGGSDEEVNLVNPAADTYKVYLHGWGVPGGSSPFKLYTWVLDSTDAGNMTVSAPAAAILGGTGTITLNFPGPFTSGIKYLGSVAYGGVAGLPNPTIVRFDAP